MSRSPRHEFAAGWIDARRKEGVRLGTINHGLKIVRRVPNLAATEWTDEYGMTWLAHAPKNRLLPDKDKRQPDPLSWDEQSRLFSEFPVHLGEMALFAVNTGCRDAEACGLQWDWECAVPELGTITFIIPGWYVKDGDERLVPAQSRDTQPDSSNLTSRDLDRSTATCSSFALAI